MFLFKKYNNKKLNQALDKAVRTNDPDKIREYLTRGANPNSKSAYGTIFHTAVFLDMITPDTHSKRQMLLDGGADIEAKDKEGRTPLHLILCCSPTQASVLFLLDRGANINTQDNNGNSPLHTLCSVGSGMGYEFVELLVKRGADMTLKNGAGLTALEVAESVQSKMTANYLKQAIAAKINSKPYSDLLDISNIDPTPAMQPTKNHL